MIVINPTISNYRKHRGVPINVISMFGFLSSVVYQFVQHRKPSLHKIL